MPRTNVLALVFVALTFSVTGCAAHRGAAGFPALTQERPGLVLERRGEQVFMDPGEQLWVAMVTPNGKRRWWLSALLGGVEGGAAEMVIGTKRGRWTPVALQDLVALGPALSDKRSRRLVRRWLKHPEKQPQPEHVLLLIGDDRWTLVFQSFD